MELTRNQIYYQKNRDKLIERSKEYREQNYERFTRARLKYHSSIHGRAMRMFSATRTRCSKMGLEFTISLEWIETKLEHGHCELTGIPFQLPLAPGHYRNPYGPSLDRKNARGGYVPDNCRMILWALNMGFADWGEEVYLEIAKQYMGNRLEYDL